MKITIKIAELEIKGALIEDIELSQETTEEETIEYLKKPIGKNIEKIVIALEEMAGITTNNEGVEKND